MSKSAVAYLPFCPNCGKEIQVDVAFCPSCGQNLKGTVTAKPATVVSLEHKSPGIAAVLALVLGIIGLMGIGHVYVGKIGKGVALLASGIILLLANLTFGSFLLGPVTLDGRLLYAGLALVFGWLGPWIWQAYDAHSLSKKFNSSVQETGKAPW